MGGGADDPEHTTPTMFDVPQKDPQVIRLLTVVIREVTQSSLNLGGFLWTVESIHRYRFSICAHNHSICFTQQKPNQFNTAAIYGGLNPESHS